ncbi:hypothetical protein HDU67_001372 [Dinochytrium kinnereticum]|nr:hypothetical protein HDU67_001372 [Dinochytrium kinnereticum]
MAILSVSWTRVAVITALASLTLLYFLSFTAPPASSKPHLQQPHQRPPVAAKDPNHPHVQKVIEDADIPVKSTPQGKIHAEGVTCYHVAGFTTCPYFQRSVAMAKRLYKAMPDKVAEPIVFGFSRDEWNERKLDLAKTVPGAGQHRTSPMVWEGCTPDVWAFVGGNDDFTDRLRITHQFSD